MFINCREGCRLSEQVTGMVACCWYRRQLEPSAGRCLSRLYCLKRQARQKLTPLPTGSRKGRQIGPSEAGVETAAGPGPTHPPLGSRVAICQHPLHRAAGRSGDRAPVEKPRRQLRQGVARDDQRAVQGRVDPPARAVEDARGGGDRLAELGVLIQPSSTDGGTGLHPPAEAEANYYRQLTEQPASES
jgi:hypothetical protein